MATVALWSRARLRSAACLRTARRPRQGAAYWHRSGCRSRALWLANLVSATGTIVQVGAAWLMTTLAGTPDLVALVQTATYLPILLLALLAGTLADLWDRRRVLLLAQFWMVSISAGLARLSGSISSRRPRSCSSPFSLASGRLDRPGLAGERARDRAARRACRRGHAQRHRDELCPRGRPGRRRRWSRLPGRAPRSTSTPPARWCWPEPSSGGRTTCRATTCPASGWAAPS